MAQTATVEIQMPAMGESVTEGTVLEWHVSEGDQVSEGDTVVEVSTDKVDAEVPAPATGIVAKLRAISPLDTRHPDNDKFDLVSPPRPSTAAKLGTNSRDPALTSSGPGGVNE